ncbi:MAG: holin family protein [Pseudomonadota bacterium]
MGLIEALFGLLFGSGRNVVKETAEVFRENAEAAGTRELDMRTATLEQFAAEFVVPRRGLFDRSMDAMNRVPRPALALGTLGLFVAAMIDPIWFAARMQGIALVPEPLWWLLGAVVSFYFGARHQSKSQEFQRSIAETLARAPVVKRNLSALTALQSGAGVPAPAEQDGVVSSEGLAPDAPNPALDAWRREQ